MYIERRASDVCVYLAYLQENTKLFNEDDCFDGML